MSVCGPIFRFLYFFQTLDPEPQHLSLTALFGKQDRATSSDTVEPPQTLQAQQPHEKLPVRQGVVRSLSYEEPKRQSPPVEKQLCPAIQKLMVRGTDLHPWSELPESRPREEGSPRPAIPPGSPCTAGAAHAPQSACRAQTLLEKLHSAPGPTDKHDLGTAAPAGPVAPGCSTALTTATPAKGVAQPQLLSFNGTLPPHTLGPQAHGKEQATFARQTGPPSSTPASSPRVAAPPELLRKLQVVPQEQQLPVPTRPALAAKFPAAAQGSRTGKPLESWINKTTSGTEKQARFLQVNINQGPKNRTRDPCPTVKCICLGRKTELSLQWLTPQNASDSWDWARPRPGAEWQGPHYLSHQLLLPRVCVSRRLESGAGARTQTQVLPSGAPTS